MAFTYGFYNSNNHDRRYNAVDISSIFDGVIEDGVFMHVGDHMTVKATGNGLGITVGTGRAWFNHTWSLVDAAYSLTLSQSDVLNSRIDAIVLEVANSARTNSLKIIKGTASSSPSKPKLTNNSNVHQYPLAYITIPANATTISQSNIENTVGTSACPFVTTVLEVMEIDDIVAAWQAQFDDWFDTLETNLSGDVAGNLQNQINELKTEDAISTYSHVVSGSVGTGSGITHIFTGTGSNGKVKMNGSVHAGDKVQFSNGSSKWNVTAYYGLEPFDEALDGESVIGKWFTFVYDGTQVNFRGGGGLGTGALAAADAEPGDVVASKKFYAGNKMLKTGTLADKAAQTNAVSVSNDASSNYFRIESGAYRTNASSGYPEIVYDCGDVNASEVLSGKTFTSRTGAGRQTGTMTNRGAWNGSVNPGGTVTIPAGWHNGQGRVSGNGSPVPAIRFVDEQFNVGSNEGQKWTSQTIDANLKTTIWANCAGYFVNMSYDVDLDLILQGSNDNSSWSDVYKVDMNNSSDKNLHVQLIQQLTSNYRYYRFAVTQSYHAGDGTARVTGALCAW